MLIECTKKLADAMKISLSDIELAERKPFYEWHANLFLFDRKKGVILMNNKTRYCIVLYGLKAEHLKKLDSLALAAIAETFTAAGFPAHKIKHYIENCGDVLYTKTHDRSILSQINDLHLHLSWEIEHHLPNSKLNMVDLNLWLSEIIMLTAEYRTPIEGLTAAFANVQTEIRLKGFWIEWKLTHRIIKESGVNDATSKSYSIRNNILFWGVNEK